MDKVQWNGRRTDLDDPNKAYYAYAGGCSKVDGKEAPKELNAISSPRVFCTLPFRL